MMARTDEEEVKKRAEIRMNTIDMLPADVRAVVHDEGWTIVKEFLVHGVTNAKSIRHLIRAVRNGSVNVLVFEKGEKK